MVNQRSVRGVRPQLAMSPTPPPPLPPSVGEEGPDRILLRHRGRLAMSPCKGEEDADLIWCMAGRYGAVHSGVEQSRAGHSRARWRGAE